MNGHRIFRTAPVLCAAGLAFAAVVGPGRARSVVHAAESQGTVASTGAVAGGPLKFASFDESRAEYDRVVVPFLAKHCVECHNAKKAEGDLNLATLEPDMKATTSGARWATVVERLGKGEMPPEGKPRPAAEVVAAAVRWAHAESKRANRHFTRRAAYENGNETPHALLFDAKHVPAFDGEARIRRLSPEIYGAFLKDAAKKSGTSQPFSPPGGTTFKDMGDPRVDEPTTAALFQNALLIVEGQTAHVIEDGKLVKFTGARELQPLFDPQVPPSDKAVDAALEYQFKTILKRPPTDREREKFVALLKRNTAEAGPTVGARYALAAVLMLPEAVFRREVGSGTPDAKGRVRLSPREIAFSLAYALTDKGPDAALLTAAATGGLDTDEGVGREVRRMLGDPKLDKPRILRFFREYFGYDQATDVFKEMNGGGVAVEFGGHEPRILVEDTDKLVEWILERDRDVLRELLTTNRSFVAWKTAADSKKKLAEARAKYEQEQKDPKNKGKKFNPQVKMVFESYGLTEFPDEQPVELPADQRAGILTQPSWLVAHSTTFDNHAIHRGKWIRERLLGNVVPDIPITVDAQLPIAPEKTLRARMAVTEQEYCWKCHRLMNDVAYPFEQYDHFGRYRTAERVLDLEATAKNVDPKGKPRGPVYGEAPVNATGLVAFVGDPTLEGPVQGPVELLRRLAGSERVEQVFVRHAFRYWLGRNESPGDAASLQAAHRAYKEGGGSMQSLIVALLSGESFLYRVPQPTEPAAATK